MLKNLRLGTAAIGLMLSACGSDAAPPVKVFDDEVVFVESGFDVRAHVVDIDHNGEWPAHRYILQLPDTICADEDVECLALYLETLSWVDDLEYWLEDREYGDFPGGFPIQFIIPSPTSSSFCVGNIGRRVDVPGPSSLWESVADGPGLWKLDIYC